MASDFFAERKPYEIFEHTADVGLQIFGRTLPELFIHAAQGMESLLVEPEQVQIKTSQIVIVEGHDTLSLLIEWLNELIFLFDTQHLLLTQFEIESFAETRLKARVSGETYQRERHDLSSAIKAATWHEAAITQSDTCYQARVIFDL